MLLIRSGFSVSLLALLKQDQPLANSMVALSSVVLVALSLVVRV